MRQQGRRVQPFHVQQQLRQQLLSIAPVAVGSVVGVRHAQLLCYTALVDCTLTDANWFVLPRQGHTHQTWDLLDYDTGAAIHHW